MTGVALPRIQLADKWLVLIAVTLGMFMSLMDSTIVNVAIPQMQRVFGADIHAVQWVVTIYMLTQAAVIPTAPYLANRLGSKRAYIWTLAAFLIGTPSSSGKSSQFIKMDSLENVFALYVRDRWRVTPKLTLNLGLRWELYPDRTRSAGLGIESVADVPGVGAGLADHPVTRLLLVPKPGSCNPGTPVALSKTTGARPRTSGAALGARRAT